MNSMLNIIKIILLSIIAITLVILLIVLLNGKINIRGIDLYEKTELVYEKTFENDISNLNIITTNNDVEIEEKDIDAVEVKIYDRKDVKPTVEVKDNTLYIDNKDDEKIGISFGITGTSKILITVPKNSTYNLDVNGTSSDVSSKIDLKDVKIETKSGDIALKNSINTKINTTSGDVLLDTVEDIYIDVTSGDISINSVNKKLDINTTSGDIKIDKINIESNSKIKATSGDVVIGKTNKIYIDAKATSGDIKIDNNNRKADYELKINTTSGDIIVRN